MGLAGYAYAQAGHNDSGYTVPMPKAMPNARCLGYWQLAEQVGLITVLKNLEVLHMQANASSSPVEVSSALVSWSVVQNVTGSIETGPDWISWLTPLSQNTVNHQEIFPQQYDGMIPANQTYYVRKKFDKETGHQKWIWIGEEPGSSDMTDPVERERYWETNVTVVENVF